MSIKKWGALFLDFDGYLIPSPFAVLLGMYLVISAWSSWFVLDTKMSDVIQRFGEHVRTVGPGGIHGKLPWPFETSREIGTTNIHQMEVGFRTEGDPRDKKYRAIQSESEMFTADMNLVQIDFTAQYKSGDAASWLFNVENPEAVLRALADSSIRNVVGGNSFDDVVTSGRGAVSAATTATMQELANKLKLGAQIVQINLQDAHPPSQVVAAFNDVNNAKEDREKLVQQGLGYYNGKIPEARGIANKKIEDATGYKNRRIAEAKGEADRFSAVLEKYTQAPELTVQRMRFETLNAVLPGKDQIVDVGGGGQNLLKLFNVNPADQSKGKE